MKEQLKEIKDRAEAATTMCSYDGDPTKHDSCVDPSVCLYKDFLKLVTAVEAQEKEKQWLINCLKNFHPFNGNLPKGLDATFYQTLTYEGDRELLNKFDEIRLFPKAERILKGESDGR